MLFIVILVDLIPYLFYVESSFEIENQYCCLFNGLEKKKISLSVLDIVSKLSLKSRSMG